MHVNRPPRWATRSSEDPNMETRDPTTENPFEGVAEEYDQWFDTPTGNAIWRREVGCLRAVLAPRHAPAGQWLEIGVGTGRFASALGIQHGIDPSAAMLRQAATRGITIRIGRGERLPYADHAFDGILLATTLCFLSDVRATFRESHRVLRPSGLLCVGLLSAAGTWGRSYTKKKQAGHPIYRHARFHPPEQVITHATEAGFMLEDARGCAASDGPAAGPTTQSSRIVVSNADFVALRLRRIEP